MAIARAWTVYRWGPARSQGNWRAGRAQSAPPPCARCTRFDVGGDDAQPLAWPPHDLVACRRRAYGPRSCPSLLKIRRRSQHAAERARDAGTHLLLRCVRQPRAAEPDVQVERWRWRRREAAPGHGTHSRRGRCTAPESTIRLWRGVLTMASCSGYVNMRGAVR